MFQGTGTAMITPFDEDMNVDYQSLKKFTRFQVDEGINALIVLGTTGEAPTINEDERNKIIETVVNEVNGKIPVIAGTGTNDTKKVAELNKSAEKLKVDGVLIVNPYYNKGTQQSLIEHYKYISERTPLPILLYNVPSRTGMNILPETAITISEQCKNVIGIKEASGNISQIGKLFALRKPGFHVYSGNDDQTLPIMAFGGSGVVSVFSNVFPKQMTELTGSLLKNDMQTAQTLNKKFLNFMNALFAETSPTPVKYAVSLLGYCKNLLRLPLTKASPDTESLVKAEVEKLQVEYAEN
ncbi:MAG: 4-hydroxy-tetrahydrodipicolinate synthase [Ignavibacteriaceae bacterium]